MKNLLKVTLLAATVAAFSMGANAQIKIGKDNKQETKAGNIINMAVYDDAKAIQNVASNHGKVEIKGKNEQKVNASGDIFNGAGVKAKAIQNISSNSSVEQ